MVVVDFMHDLSMIEPEQILVLLLGEQHSISC